jgi:hypothetical protein
VQIVRDDPLDRIAQDVDQLDVRHDLREPFRHALVPVPLAVGGGRLAADLGGIGDPGAIPVEALAEVARRNEEVRLLRGHADLGCRAR